MMAKGWSVHSLVALLLVLVGCSSTGKQKVTDGATLDLRTEEQLAGSDHTSAADQVAGDAAREATTDADLFAQCDTDCVTSCQSDEDCPACSSCDAQTGHCLPIPCPAECEVDGDCSQGEVCVTNNGCCGSCQPEDPCAVVDCIQECDIDSDCDSGESCIWFGQGCCSQCEPQCELCALDAGTYCPETPPPADCELGAISVTEVGTCWFELTYQGDQGTDTLLVDGCASFAQNLETNGCGLTFDEFGGVFDVACNGCGTVKYAQENCSCTPDCTGKSCGPDGCGGSCGECDIGCFCADNGQCMGCGGDLLELEPLCVHVPTVVGAGQPFAVAVYGLLGCSSFDHYEVDTAGTEFSITLYGTASADPDCPPLAFCQNNQWSHLGLIWLEAPNPGTYTVKVGSQFTAQVGATGGIIGEPNCDDACPQPALENYDWTLRALTDAPLLAQCLEPGNDDYQDEALAITGACQNYTLGSVGELPEMPVKHCTDGHLLFGGPAPYWMEGTVCGSDPLVDGHPPVILGTIQQEMGAPLPTQMFLVEGVPLWN